MSDEFQYKVKVSLSNGTSREFYADFSYDSTSQGRVVYWKSVLLDGKRLDTYSIPTNMIVDIQEQDLQS